MLYTIIWAAALLIFLLGEALTVELTSIWFAAGSLAALICALLDGPPALQFTLFIVVSTLAMLAFRPLAKKYLNSKVEPTNADQVIGATAPIIEDIDNLKGTGRVLIRSMPWAARSEDGSCIPEGSLVQVKRIEGVKVYVELKKTEKETKL